MISHCKRLSRNPIFIGGSGRSGTTLIGSILSSHPDILYFSEPRFLIDAGGIVDFLKEKITENQFFCTMMYTFQPKLVTSIQESIRKSSKMYIAEEIFAVSQIEQILKESFIPNRNRLEVVTRFVDNIFHHGRVSMKKNRCVEKTPHTVKIADLLWKMFPDMKYIHALRDPKDVCCSVLPLPWGPNSITEFINYYNRVMESATLSLKAIPQNQLLTVELENMVNKPKETIDILFDFLGLRYSSNNLSEYTNIVRTPQKSTIKRHTKELSSEDIQKIDQNCSKLYLDLRKLSNSIDYNH